MIRGVVGEWWKRREGSVNRDDARITHIQQYYLVHAVVCDVRVKGKREESPSRL